LTTRAVPADAKEYAVLDIVTADPAGDRTFEPILNPVAESAVMILVPMVICIGFDVCAA
jgi:hypothetical protein